MRLHVVHRRTKLYLWRWMFMHFSPSWWIRVWSHLYCRRIRDHALETVGGIECVACMKLARESSPLAIAFCWLLAVVSSINSNKLFYGCWLSLLEETVRESQHITLPIRGWLEKVWRLCVCVSVAYFGVTIVLELCQRRVRCKILTQLNHATPKVKNKNQFQEKLKTFAHEKKVSVWLAQWNFSRVQNSQMARWKKWPKKLPELFWCREALWFMMHIRRADRFFSFLVVHAACSLASLAEKGEEFVSK